jgi:Ca-activated chloride channel family protein
LETGLQGSVEPFMVRALADVLLALVLSFSTLLIAVGGENSGLGSGLRGSMLNRSQRSERRSGETIRKQFR